MPAGTPTRAPSVRLCVGAWLCAVALTGFEPGATAAPAPPETPSFTTAVSELRATVTQVQALRKQAGERGDKVKEACLYERQRALSQIVDSSQEAQVAWEAATKKGDKEKARTEEERLKKALELGRSLRGEAESCVGGELKTGSRPTTVTVSGPKVGDESQAGPSETHVNKPLRLELPSRPNPASAFRPNR